MRHIDEIGREVATFYDGRHRVVERTWPEGDKAQFLYDARDNVIKLTKTAKPSACTPNMVSETGDHDACEAGHCDDRMVVVTLGQR